jgi:hypothetical protein
MNPGLNLGFVFLRYGPSTALKFCIISTLRQIAKTRATIAVGQVFVIARCRKPSVSGSEYRYAAWESSGCYNNRALYIEVDRYRDSKKKVAL